MKMSMTYGVDGGCVNLSCQVWLNLELLDVEVIILFQGPQGYEETISFANWDVFWYTRGFPSMDSERSRRHASKLLTYPITIGGAVHQNSGLTLRNQRVTPEGSRSLAGNW